MLLYLDSQRKKNPFIINHSSLCVPVLYIIFLLFVCSISLFFPLLSLSFVLMKGMLKCKVIAKQCIEFELFLGPLVTGRGVIKIMTVFEAVDDP